MTTKFAKSDPGVALTQVIRQAERAVAPLYGDHFPRFFPYRRDCPDNFRPLETQSFFFPDSSLFPPITIKFLQHRHDKFFQARAALMPSLTPSSCLPISLALPFLPID